MSNKIRVLVNTNHYYAAGMPFCELLEEKIVDNKLEEFQKLVGGLIEPLTICVFNIGDKKYAIDLVCNDEGKLLNLEKTAFLIIDKPKNIFDVVCGNFFIAVCDRSKGEYVDMDDNVYDAIERAFQVASISIDAEILLLPTFEPDNFTKVFRVLEFV